jgi:hypothetical protein
MTPKQTRFCQCGCGEQLGNQPKQKWASPSCRTRGKTKLPDVFEAEPITEAKPDAAPAFAMKFEMPGVGDALWCQIEVPVTVDASLLTVRDTLRVLLIEGRVHRWVDVHDVPEAVWRPWLTGAPVRPVPLPEELRGRGISSSFWRLAGRRSGPRSESRPKQSAWRSGVGPDGSWRRWRGGRGWRPQLRR